MLKRSVAVVVGWALATGLQAQDLEQGRRWMQEGKTAEAIEVFTGLLRASPTNSDALLLRGLAYARSGQWALATQDLEAATVASPNYADVWSALGNVYRWTDRPAAAANAYARLASLRPTDPEATWPVPAWLPPALASWGPKQPPCSLCNRLWNCARRPAHPPAAATAGRAM